MSIVQDDCIVLKSIRYGETSRIINVLSNNNGKFSAIIKGVRKPGSRSGGVIEPLNLINVVVYFKKDRDLQLISKAEFRKAYKNIQKDLDKLSSGYRMVELVNKAVYDNEPVGPVFELLAESIALLDEEGINNNLILLYFQAKLSLMMGISHHFDTIDNINDRHFPDKDLFNLSPDILNYLNAVSKNKFSEIYKEQPENETILKLNSIYDKFLSRHIENFGQLRAKNIIFELNN
ncbi:hypothetical protein BH10BAC5_BH10BAC5_00700 [soil metagenome]